MGRCHLLGPFERAIDHNQVFHVVDGLLVAFSNHTNGAVVSFRSNDVWRIYTHTDLSVPTNRVLAFGMTNGVSCSICHDTHSQAATPFDTNAPAYGGAGTGAGRHYMSADNTTEQMCIDCHRSRSVTNANRGSHPVGIVLTTGLFYRAATNFPLERTTRKLRCLSCHDLHRSATTDGTLLRMTNGAAFCASCHKLADTLTPASHFILTNNGTVWPGGQYGSLFPARSNLADRGSCAACHFVHGWPDAANPTNHYPTLLVDREENLCFSCHDADGPAGTDLQTEFQKAVHHPVALSGRHINTEDGNPGAFGTTNRHAECMDCHNPHMARRGYDSRGVSLALAGVSRVVVTNGAAGSAPAYGFVPSSDTNTPVEEYQICFKCHSGWTSLPSGKRDLGILFNPANAAAHPVQGAGANTSSYMIASLAGGTGLPHLSVTSTVTCADCHNNNDIPTSISLVRFYTGTVAGGVHGSVSNANMNGSILRADYRMTRGSYSAASFALCFICHLPAPFNTTSDSNRSDTRFEQHGKHMREYQAACVDCHDNNHGTAITRYPANTGYARLVSFGTAVTGARVWTMTANGGTCTMTCHGEGHNPRSY
ncbi:MAG: cytochrome c3 family protein [bacterium]